jgi:hypothetical protein
LLSIQGLVEQMRTFSNNTARTFKYRVNSQLLAIAQVRSISRPGTGAH